MVDCSVVHPDPEDPYLNMPLGFLLLSKIQRNCRKNVYFFIKFIDLLPIWQHVFFNGHKNVQLDTGSVIDWAQDYGSAFRRQIRIRMKYLRIHNTDRLTVKFCISLLVLCIPSGIEQIFILLYGIFLTSMVSWKGFSFFQA
jgi:hypothetical protein